MKNDKDYIFVRSLIDKYRLNEKYFHLDEKYLSSYVDRIVYEYRVMDTLTFVTSKWSRVSSYFLKYLSSWVELLVCNQVTKY